MKGQGCRFGGEENVLSGYLMVEHMAAHCRYGWHLRIPTWPAEEAYEELWSGIRSGKNQGFENISVCLGCGFPTQH